MIRLRLIVLASLAIVGSIGSFVRADIIVSEIHSTGSSNTTYVADWFELSNNGNSEVTISGWRFDDNSNAFASSVELVGVTSIGAGQSVVFIEGAAPATTAAFISAWFGANPPQGFAIGTYSGAGIGLSSGGDAINVFNSTGTAITSTVFGAATAGTTFENSAGLGNTSQLSAVGANGAFVSVAGGEIGSPGSFTITAVPEPSSVACISLPMMFFAGYRRWLRRASAA